MSDEQLLAAVEKTVNTAVEAMKVDLLEHIHAVGGQLHTQIQEIMDRQDARLERQGGLIQGGARAIVRMVEWTETADTTLSRYDRRLAEFERRLDQIEKAGK
jgi:chloramphenicol 3-O-phosphotransferase